MDRWLELARLVLYPAVATALVGCTSVKVTTVDNYVESGALFRVAIVKYDDRSGPARIEPSVEHVITAASFSTPLQTPAAVRWIPVVVPLQLPKIDRPTPIRSADSTPTIAPPPAQLIIESHVALFPFDSAVLTAPARLALQSFVQKNELDIAKNTSIEIRVVGHTDDVGADRYNAKLSEKRAFAIKSALVALGVAEQSIRTLALGATRPVESNTTEVGRAKNRRVEVTPRSVNQ